VQPVRFCDALKGEEVAGKRKKYHSWKSEFRRVSDSSMCAFYRPDNKVTHCRLFFLTRQTVCFFYARQTIALTCVF
jgi:hypothetical protein